VTEKHTTKVQRALAALQEEISKGLRKGLPIVVGPWILESGYELLYWIPFVRWIVETNRIPRERLLVVSRGGTASWYGDLATRYSDVFSVASLEEFEDATNPQETLHGDWSAIKRRRRATRNQFIEKITERLARVHGFEKITHVHPDVLDTVFRPYWAARESTRYLEEYSLYRPFQPPPALLGLPADYVAVRFYSNMFFHKTKATRKLVHDVINAIQDDLPVVLLDQPVSWRGHEDLCDPRNPVLRIFTDTVDLASNYTLQTAVIGHARAFVGNYGSLAYLPAFCGVPSIAVNREPRWESENRHGGNRRHHLAFQNICRHFGATFVMSDVDDSANQLAEQVRRWRRGGTQQGTSVARVPPESPGPA